MKKLIASSAIILLCLFSVHAKVYETLVLNDGFRLQGYIVERVPGENMTMDVESIVGTIDDEFIQDTQDVVQNGVSMLRITLNDEGIKALGGDDDLKPIENNYALNSVLGPVKMLHKGRNEYVFAPKNGCGKYVIDENLIVAIETSPRDQDASRGIMDVVETRDLIYEGQIVKNVLGQEIYMNNEEGVPYDPINVDEIVSMKVEALDKEEDIITQAEFLDVIKVEGYDTPLEGVILEKIYEDDSDNDKVVIYTLSGDEVAVSTNSITKFCREKNKDFKPGVKYTVNNGEVWVSGNRAKRYDGKFEHNKNSYGIVNATAKKDAIEIRYADLNNGELVVESKNESQFRNPYLIMMNSGRTAPRGASKNMYFFDDSELMNSRSNVVEQGRPNSKNVVKTIFKVKEPSINTSDLYILFYKNDKEDQVYIIKVKR